MKAFASVTACLSKEHGDIPTALSVIRFSAATPTAATL